MKNIISSNTIPEAIGELVESYWWDSNTSGLEFSMGAEIAKLALDCAGACENPYSMIFVTISAHDEHIVVESHDVSSRNGVASLVGASLMLAKDFCDSAFQVWAYAPTFDRETHEWVHKFEHVNLR